jgi:hypothetical protein
MTTLATYLFGFRVEAIKYPWREAINSALELSDAVWFAACDEETLQLAHDFRRNNSKLHIIRREWGTHHSIQARLGNDLLGCIGQDYDYAFKQDADEVACEWSFPEFREELEVMNKNNVLLGRPHYTHFSPDFETTWPFIYSSKATICQTRACFRYNTDPRQGNADACALGGAPEFQTRLELFHYGKVGYGREREALEKEVEFQKLYSHPEDAIGFPDPKVIAQIPQGYLDYTKVFDVSLSRGEFKRYDGPHPKFVRGWRQEMEARHKRFVQEMSLNRSAM